MPATALDFSNAAGADKALKQIKTLMIRAGQPVISTEFNDKPKRSNGVTYREASLTLASGQLVTLRVTATGDVYQVLLNGAVKPIKSHDDYAKAVGEIAAMAEKSQGAFQKAQARKQVELPAGMTTPAPKMEAVMTQKVAELDGLIAERRATVADLQQQLGAMTDSIDSTGEPQETSQGEQKAERTEGQRTASGAEPVLLDNTADQVPELSGAATEVLRALGERGPLEDGDVPSKVGRDELEGLGLIDRYTAVGANVLNEAGRSALGMLDNASQEDAVMALGGAYVAAREIVAGNPAMLDSAATAGAVAQLRMALEVVETNYPINLKAGNFDQAHLELDLAGSFRAAIGMLDSAGSELNDAGLAQLVAIAQAAAAEDTDITDQDALAQLLALGLVETAEGLYMVTSKGKSALDDAGYDPYGEPYAAGD